MRDVIIFKMYKLSPYLPQQRPMFKRKSKPRLNSILMLRDMDLANWLKSLVLAAKYPCGVLLRKNGSLGELRHQEFIAFLVVDSVCYNSVSVKGDGEDNGLEFCGGTCFEVWLGKQWWRCQIKPINTSQLSVSAVKNL